MTQLASDSRATCPNCQPGRETFWYMRHRYLYDIDQARLLVADGREAVEVDEESVRHAVETSEINDEHLAHVDPGIPGIIAHIGFPDPSGKIVRGHLLIDGHHRAARCLELGIPFSAYILDEEESEDVLLRSPSMSPAQESCRGACT